MIKLLTSNEAAKLLGVSGERVRTWCEEGRFPSYRSVPRLAENRPGSNSFGRPPAPKPQAEWFPL